MLNTLKEIFIDHINNVSQIIKLAKADLVKTYRGAALGWGWAVIKPSVTIFAYWFAFSFGLRANRDIGGFPFFLWLICGMIPWFYMSDMIVMGTGSIKKYHYLVTKLKYPISTIPTFVSISKLIVNVIMIAICILIFVISGFTPNIYYIQIPIIILMSFTFFTIFAQFSSLIAAISKDYANLVKSFVTAIFWFSGILYDANAIHIPWIKKLLFVNPITYLVTCFRDAFINQKWFFEEVDRLIIFLVVTLVFLLLYLVSYKRLKKEIPDVL